MNSHGATGRGANTEQAAATVASWALNWSEQARASDRSADTWTHYRERTSSFVVEFADRPLASFDREEARAWAERNRGRLFAVGAMFSDAEKAGLILVNPFARLGLRQGQRTRVAVLTPDELHRLVAAATRVHGPYGRAVYGPMLTVIAWAGLEPSELYGLRPADVDLKECVLHLRRVMSGRSTELKEIDRPRRVAILPATKEALRHVKVGGMPINEPIFRTQQARALNQRSQARYWPPVRDAFAATLLPDHWLNVRVRERGDQGKLMMGELRHLFGAELAARGVSPSDIATLMGDRDGGKRAEDLYFRNQRGSAVARALAAFCGN